MNLKIKEVIGVRCIIKDDGQKVYDLIHDNLKSGEKVVLDFSEVTQFASPFFNFSIGRLLVDISELELKKLLYVENINETGQLVIERVIENASKYHTNTNYKKIVDAILEQQSGNID